MPFKRTRLVAAAAVTGLLTAGAIALSTHSAGADESGDCTATAADQIVTKTDASTTLEMEVVCTGNASAERIVTVTVLDKEVAELQVAADAKGSARGYARATVEGGVTEVCIDDPEDSDPETCVAV